MIGWARQHADNNIADVLATRKGSQSSSADPASERLQSWGGVGEHVSCEPKWPSWVPGLPG